MASSTDSTPRPLHLHTVASLCADLISGRSVSLGADQASFALSGPEARGALEWYRKAAGKWTAQVRDPDAEGLVNAVFDPPPTHASIAGAAAGNTSQRLHLTRVEAHRFAGLHAFSMHPSPPETFIFEPTKPVTLFEGLNGSGKTSLANAIVWTLTGQVLRPQRKPEPGTDEFWCEIMVRGNEASPTIHRLSVVTPLPAGESGRPSTDWVDADTWVELTFTDQAGATLPAVRRTQSRTSRGKLEETVVNLDSLGLDPACLRVGTVMPGLLPYIQVGSASELGKAVAELTGLSDLVDLSNHAKRARARIDGESTKARQRDIAAADEAYGRAREDIVRLIAANSDLSTASPVSAPSSDPALEGEVTLLVGQLAKLKADALRGAKEILGDSFNPEDKDARDDLIANVQPASSEVKQLGRLPSAKRLSELGRLEADQIGAARAQIARVLAEAEALAHLASNPSSAARARLYARVAAWSADHPHETGPDGKCMVCGSGLDGATDPITGLPVAQHVASARSADAVLLSQTFGQWSAVARGALARDLPDPLRLALTEPLPEHPGELVQAALCRELFEAPPFAGVLAALSPAVSEACNAAISSWPPLANKGLTQLPAAASHVTALQSDLDRLDLALRHAEWRQENMAVVTALLAGVVGSGPTPSNGTLLGKLHRLRALVEAAEPITLASAGCERLKVDLGKRRVAERRLVAYAVASRALLELMGLGDLAQKQVNTLQERLYGSASNWRKRIYSGAFPSTHHELTGTSMSSAGQIDLKVGSNGVAAPAQHVANASALRASLVGFYLAYWEHVMQERGGLRLLLLDDPQELLDEENRERLAGSLHDLLGAQAQLIVTTHDRRFAAHVTALARLNVSVDHRSIHPATGHRPTMQVPVSVSQIVEHENRFKADHDDVKVAQDYASECRTFIEARLGDMFDDTAYPAWSVTDSAPTLASHLGRLRRLVNAPPSDLFRSKVFQDVCNDPGLADHAPVRRILNQAHHNKHDIRPVDVVAVAGDLVRIRKAVENAHEECRRWRRRDRPEPRSANVINLRPLAALPTFSVLIHPDLAAFTSGSGHGGTQDVAAELIGGAWLASKALFYVRSDNLGFQVPRGAIAVVDSEPYAGEDRDLVIARHRESVHARRLPSKQYVERPDARNRDARPATKATHTPASGGVGEPAQDRRSHL